MSETNKPSALFLLAEVKTDHHTIEVINQWRDEGASLSTVSHMLFAEYQLDVTPQTIANWLEKYGQEEESDG